jgi:hypothetical protein
MVLGASGLLAGGLASGAYAATTASTASTAKSVAAQSPGWHTVLSVPNGTVANEFETVVATGKTTGWAFQYGGAAYERTGASWKAVAFPGTGGAVKVAGASSPSDVWAAYQSTGGGVADTIDHWNGRSWTTSTTLPTGAVTAISVLGPGDVWVFGAGVYHFNGRTWTEVSATLGGGSALSDNNVWAFNGTAVEHYNGRTWTATDVTSLLPPQLSGHAAPSVTNIIALAPNNVYATGEGEQTPRGGPGVVLHYNGRTWTRVAESSAFAAVGGEMASDGEGGLWIEAQGYPARLPELFHYSAGQLTAVDFGATSLSVSQIPGTSEALAAGFTPGTGTSSSVVWQYS